MTLEAYGIDLDADVQGEIVGDHHVESALLRLLFDENYALSRGNSAKPSDCVKIAGFRTH